MKTILLFDPRFPDRGPRRLTVDDAVASASVRAGVAAAANPAEHNELAVGGPLDAGDLTEVVLQHGYVQLVRAVLPLSVALVGNAAGVLATIGAAAAEPPVRPPDTSIENVLGTSMLLGTQVQGFAPAIINIDTRLEALGV